MKWPFYFDWPVSDRTFRHCCTAMTNALDFHCDMHPSPFECGDYDLVYNEVFDETGIQHPKYERTYTRVRHCPFCGARKPPSARMRWERALAKLGFDLFGDAFQKFYDQTSSYTLSWRALGVPEKYLSAAWRLQRG
jgi:hypothetical protein